MMVTLSRLQAYGLVSTTVFVSTVINAFRQRSNFYAAAVYLSKSNACMMILWNQAIYQTVLFGKLLQLIFLGQLRLIEVERLQERGWFAVTETLLALTIFKDEFESTFVLLFVSLLFLKVFHWLASDRVEAMEQSASVSRLAQARMIGLLSLLWIADVVMVLFAAECILVEGPTVMIMFASEYMILVASVWATSMKYIITCIDMRREVQWEEKSIYVFYVELVADFFKLVTYLTFFGLTLTFYGLPLNILRDVYLTLRSFLLRIRDLRRYRLATKNMDTLYPNATREEMEEMNDKTCIICREDMEFQSAPGEENVTPTTDPAGQQSLGTPPAAPATSPRPISRGLNETPKKLPCGHVFHFHCLKSWLERQQSCPTCRRPVLPQEQPTRRTPAAERGERRNEAGEPDERGGAQDANNHNEALRQAQINLARNLGREAFGVVFPDLPFPEEAARPGDGPTSPQPTPSVPNDASSPAVPSSRATPNTITPAAEPSGAASSPQPPSNTAASPVASTSTRGPTARGPRARLPSLLLSPSSPPSPSGSESSNPLARFSLPELDVPSTGEAGLYHAPPSFGNIDLELSGVSSGPSMAQAPYADLAYGAFPQFGGRVTNVPPPPGYASAGSGAKPPTLEERIKQIREKMSTAEGGPRAGEESTRARGEGVVAAKQDKGKGKEKAPISHDEAEGEKDAIADQEEEGEGTVASRRRAALVAAERRRVAQTSRPPSPSSWLRKTDTLAPWSEAAHATPLPPSREPSPTPPASRGPTNPPSPSRSGSAAAVTGASGVVRPRPATAVPRLIPLFDPANPAAGSEYPALTREPLSRAVPSPSSSSTSSRQQLVEVDRLIRREIEDKLRMLVEFQDRLEGLVDEMRTSLGSIGDGNGRGSEARDDDGGPRIKEPELVEALEKVAAHDDDDL